MATTTLSAPTDLLKRAWERFKSRWQVALIASLIFALVYMLVSFLMAGSLIAGGAIGSFKAVSGAAIVAGIVSALIGVYTSGMMYNIFLDDSVISLKVAAQRTNKIYKPLLITGIISVLVISGAAVLFVIPAIVLAVYFTQATLIAITDGVSGMTALRRSRALTNNKWGQLLWRFIFLGIVLMLVTIVVDGLFRILGAGYNSSSLSNMIVNLISGPLTVAYMVEIYKDLRGGTAEMGGQSFYNVLAVLGIVGIIGFFSAMSWVAQRFSGTISSEWQRAIEESGASTGSYNYGADWNFDFNSDDFQMPDTTDYSDPTSSTTE